MGPVSDAETGLAECAAALADAVETALPGWVVRSVERVLAAWLAATDREPRPNGAVMAHAREAGHRARAEIGAEVRRLLQADVDEQWTNPLDVLRRATKYPTKVLRDAGVGEVERDEFAVRTFPDDVYHLAPAAFTDIDPSLHEPGLRWGAAKALVFLQRRREEPH